MRDNLACKEISQVDVCGTQLGEGDVFSPSHRNSQRTHDGPTPELLRSRHNLLHCRVTPILACPKNLVLVLPEESWGQSQRPSLVVIARSLYIAITLAPLHFMRCHRNGSRDTNHWEEVAVREVRWGPGEERALWGEPQRTQWFGQLFGRRFQVNSSSLSPKKKKKKKSNQKGRKE